MAEHSAEQAAQEAALRAAARNNMLPKKKKRSKPKVCAEPKSTNSGGGPKTGSRPSRDLQPDSLICDGFEVVSVRLPWHMGPRLRDADWGAEVMPVISFEAFQSIPSAERVAAMTNAERYDCATPPPCEPISVSRGAGSTPREVRALADTTRSRPSEARTSPRFQSAVTDPPFSTYLRPPKRIRDKNTILGPSLPTFAGGPAVPRAAALGSGTCPLARLEEDASVIEAQAETASQHGLPRGWRMEVGQAARASSRHHWGNEPPRNGRRCILSPDGRLFQAFSQAQQYLDDCKTGKASLDCDSVKRMQALEAARAGLPDGWLALKNFGDDAQRPTLFASPQGRLFATRGALAAYLRALPPPASPPPAAAADVYVAGAGAEPAIAVGARIEARWHGYDEYYSGTVIAIQQWMTAGAARRVLTTSLDAREATVDIDYDDGEDERCVPLSLIRLPRDLDPSTNMNVVPIDADDRKHRLMTDGVHHNWQGIVFDRASTLWRATVRRVCRVCERVGRPSRVHPSLPFRYSANDASTTHRAQVIGLYDTEIEAARMHDARLQLLGHNQSHLLLDKSSFGHHTFRDVQGAIPNRQKRAPLVKRFRIQAGGAGPHVIPNLASVSEARREAKLDVIALADQAAAAVAAEKVMAKKKRPRSGPRPGPRPPRPCEIRARASRERPFKVPRRAADAPSPAAARQGEHAAIPEEDDIEESYVTQEHAWVCCDVCGKWRTISEETHASLDEDQHWECRYNADKTMASCLIPEEDWDEEEPELTIEAPTQARRSSAPVADTAHVRRAGKSKMLQSQKGYQVGLSQGKWDHDELASLREYIARIELAGDCSISYPSTGAGWDELAEELGIYRTGSAVRRQVVSLIDDSGRLWAAQSWTSAEVAKLKAHIAAVEPARPSNGTEWTLLSSQLCLRKSGAELARKWDLLVTQMRTASGAASTVEFFWPAPPHVEVGRQIARRDAALRRAQLPLLARVLEKVDLAPRVASVSPSPGLPPSLPQPLRPLPPRAVRPNMLLTAVLASGRPSPVAPQHRVPAIVLADDAAAPLDPHTGVLVTPTDATENTSAQSTEAPCQPATEKPALDSAATEADREDPAVSDSSE